MASITFSGLQNIQTVNKYDFVDLHLDFNKPVQRDVAIDYDQAAIVNSINNLFNTIPGQNLLNPEYGLNLMQYLFMPATNTTANLVGQTILKNLTFFEPRVSVKNIDISVNPDDNSMAITLSILIPSLNTTINIPGTLTNNGYTLLPIQ